ncbi:MAG: isochorismate synthase [Bauldia sp.]|nr:isochorismate synthase [Bauldia sp.]
MTALGPLPRTASAAPVALGGEAAPLVLLAGGSGIVGRGAIEIVPADSGASLGAAMADLQRRSGDEAGRRVVGLMPFRADLPAYAYAVEAIDGNLPEPAARPRGTLTVRQDPSPQNYAAAVRAAVEAIAAEGSGLRKVVLARSLVVGSSEGFDIPTLLSRLRRDKSVLTFSVPLPALPGERRTLVGATPELLVRKRAGTVISEPLAGSAARSSDPATDRERAEGLLRSEKDLREHRPVVEAVLDALAPYCTGLRASAPAIASTATMWHLGTRIEGTLRSADTTAAELAAALHPTPAVCGTPREAARALIAALEPVERGFFAGALGWSDARGDGDWHVVIRCAEIGERTARLFAGAGIVEGSEPEAELRETEAKFAALLRALGIEEAA